MQWNDMFNLEERKTKNVHLKRLDGGYLFKNGVQIPRPRLV